MLTETELTPAPKDTYSIRYVWGLDVWALDLPNNITIHYFTQEAARVALIEHLHAKHFKQ